jgi:preprotein translocase subunit SecY
MSKTNTLSLPTRRNWWIDAGLAISALLAFLTGVYFLFLPIGGYQGGRNPMYGITILFQRSTWENLHTWGGVAMIAIVLLHFTLHWSWVTNMANRTVKELRGRVGPMNGRGRFNLVLNIVVALSFLLTALSGVFFLFFPEGRAAAGGSLLFSRLTWDLIHTWAGVTLISAAVVHFAIHWKWVVKVTRSLFAGLLSRRQRVPSSEAALSQ